VILAKVGRCDAQGVHVTYLLNTCISDDGDNDDDDDILFSTLSVIGVWMVPFGERGREQILQTT